MKTLVIAEKPSVAQDLARALGKFKKVDDHFENEQYVISSAVGHLVELFMPEDIDKKRYGFWRLGELPIIPEKFQLKVITHEKRSSERFDHLKALMKREDVTEILNACDAGREGELIFTYIYELAKCKKPYRRVWMQSMTQDAIRTAFEGLRSPQQMQGLQDAARSRSEADWLIGINGTRAFTKRMFGKSKGVATVGRVQTPTLSIVYQRELEIRNFTPQTFWRLLGQFSVEAGGYEGVYQKPKVDKANEHDKAERLWDGTEADRLLAECQRATHATVEDVRKRTTQMPQPLFDLTSLQREANSRFGYAAGRTLQLAQALYEKHKVLTYPRTDSRALPEDYIGTVVNTLRQLEGDYADKAAPVLANQWVRPNKRIFNNAAVSDHFAIIPTGQMSDKLSPEEQRIFDLVVRRFIAIFYPPAEFDVTTRTTTVAGHAFKTEGKVLVKPGYLEVHGKTQLDQQLPPVGEGDKAPAWARGKVSPLPQPGTPFLAQVEDLGLTEEQTKPPARYTEATLLSAMEGAGKLLDDEELAAAMKERGLGTPATRAATIEHLIGEKYMEREGRNLLPTTKAENLFQFLGAIKVDALTSPQMTGEWEYKLRLMEEGKLTRTDFMRGITDITKDMVEKTKNFEEKEEEAVITDIVSPTDGQPFRKFLRSYKSQDGALTIYETIAQRKLAPEEVATLVREGKVGPLDNFRSRFGKPFSALLKLDLEEKKVKFDFGNGASGGGEGGDSTPTGVLPEYRELGIFKETGAKVYETPNAYACERQLTGVKEGAFRMGRTMLGKVLPPEEIQKLLAEGKTGLIEGFRSNRTKRLFDAFLILKKGGGIGFEFPPRAPKKAAAKKVATKKTTKASAPAEHEPQAGGSLDSDVPF